MAFRWLCLAAAVLALELPVRGQNNTVGQGIITVQDGKFGDAGCREFQFSGGNVWELMEATAGRLKPNGAFPNGQTVTQHLFSQAVADNIQVIRTFAHGATPNFILQTAPGQYNEEAFRALDQIIADADAAGAKLILTLTDNWRTDDGLLGYVYWAGGKHPEEFYVNPAVIALYNNHQRAMANRVNTITNRKYKDEPAIFAWDLINEPRSHCDIAKPNATCEAGQTAAIQAWIQQAADNMKLEDPNHMVTVGEEGFYGFGAPAASLATNPNSDSTGWATRSGHNFLENHRPASIDFCATHIWTDNWAVNATDGVNPADFISKWIAQRAADASSLGKPLVIEEFGKQLQDFSAASIAEIRDPIFRDIYAALQNLETVKGVAYWEHDYLNGATKSDNLVRRGDSTFTNILLPAAKAVGVKVAALPPVNGCVPGPIMASTGGGIISSLSSVNSPQPPSVATSGRKLLAV
ncbi:hypothetical protein ABBQ38_007225 [Trebouxia sp. C0009 RCD-2024]